MYRKTLLAVAAGFLVACGDGSDPATPTLSKGAGSGTISANGIVYAMTPAPDSQRIAIAGATVTLVWTGPLVPYGPDDTMLTVRTSLLDSVVPPPPPPPPPAECASGDTVASVRTSAGGAWTAGGLAEGLYTVRVDPPAGSAWRGIAYCAYPVRELMEAPLVLYLGTPFGNARR